MQEVVDEVGVGNQFAVVFERYVRQILHQFGIRVFFIRQDAGFQRRGNQGFQVALGIARVGVFGGNDFALLGNADLSGNAACRLRQNSLVRWAAAATYAAAAAVEQAHADIVFFEEFDQAQLCLIQTP